MDRLRVFVVVLVIVVIGVSYIIFNRQRVLRSPTGGIKTTLPGNSALSPAPSDALTDEQRMFYDKYQLSRIRLPAGFGISVFAEVPTARSLTISPSGVVYVGNRQNGTVYALVDRDKDGVAERMYPLTSGLHVPNGVAFKDGDLYVTTITTVYRLADIENKLDTPPQPEVIYDKFPSDEAHGWKYTAFGPDGKLYIAVGVPCNSCLSENPVYGTITRLNVETKTLEIVARGLRNSVGFDWRPGDNQFWFTDNGRDRMGDDVPGDELNTLRTLGEHFGAPYCYEENIQDPDITPARPCRDFTAPVQVLGPHVAALGMRFYTGNMFPKEYNSQIFIAEHGSWNRTTPIGYRVTIVQLMGDQSVSYKPFAEGWLDESTGQAWGRPVDVAVSPDGSLLVSDDKAGVIYRIFYKE